MLTYIVIFINIFCGGSEKERRAYVPGLVKSVCAGKQRWACAGTFAHNVRRVGGTYQEGQKHM